MFKIIDKIDDNDLADLLNHFASAKEYLSAIRKVMDGGYVTITKDDLRPAYRSLDYSIKQIIIHCLDNYEKDKDGVVVCKERINPGDYVKIVSKFGSETWLDDMLDMYNSNKIFMVTGIMDENFQYDDQGKYYELENLYVFHGDCLQEHNTKTHVTFKEGNRVTMKGCSDEYRIVSIKYSRVKLKNLINDDITETTIDCILLCNGN